MEIDTEDSYDDEIQETVLGIIAKNANDAAAPAPETGDTGARAPQIADILDEVLLPTSEPPRDEEAPVSTPQRTDEVLLNIPAPRAADAEDARDTAAEDVVTVDDEGEEEEEEYEVEAIVADRTRRGKKQYLLKWKGYPDSENTWEDEESLCCPELLYEYLQTKAIEESEPRPRSNHVKEKVVPLKMPQKVKLPQRNANKEKDTNKYRIISVKKLLNGVLYEVETTTKLGLVYRKHYPSSFVKEKLSSRILVDFLSKMFQQTTFANIPPTKQLA